MNVKTIGRKVNLKKNFVDMVEKRMSKLDRYFNDDAECLVTVTVEKDRQTAEVTVKSRGLIFRAERTAPDMETAFSDASDMIVKQIVKNKEKLGTRIKRAALELDETADAAVRAASYDVAREKRFAVNSMAVEEAILRMNMLDHSFFIFRNDDSGELNVVYRRHDETFGLLIPED